jgi:hypothetical protein
VCSSDLTVSPVYMTSGAIIGNNANFGSTTSIDISDSSLTGAYTDWFDALDTIAASGKVTRLQITQVSDTSIFGIFTVGNVFYTALDNFWTIALTFVVGGGAWGSTETYSVSWIADGSAGTPGANGTNGTNGTSGTSGSGSGTVSGTTGSIAKFTSSTAVGNATVDVDYLQQDMQVVAAQGMGSVIKGYSIGTPILGTFNSGQQFNNAAGTTGQINWLAVWIPKTVTLTGVKWYQITAGVYTANNYNGVALYSHSSGTLTQVASSTNDGNIWKATSSTFASKAFSSTYSAAPGLYYIASIWCYSAYTTLPTVASGSLSTLGSQSAFATFDFTNNHKFSGYMTSQTALPATQALSGISPWGQRFINYLY